MPIVPWTELIILEAMQTINSLAVLGNFGSFATYKVGIFWVRAIFLNGKEASPHPLSRF
jgi:hypothetical protein